MRLREQSIKLVPRKIKLYGSNYLSKSSNQDFGYTFYVSDPFYTSCKRYAFLQITAYHKYLFLGKVDRSIYSQHTLMFKKLVEVVGNKLGLTAIGTTDK
ncbi:MAG: hypothetical protein IPH94_15905 [Saprospiraceae bacterium]|nr:hypothetical protein [Saprospiraceae bacterium]